MSSPYLDATCRQLPRGIPIGYLGRTVHENRRLVSLASSQLKAVTTVRSVLVSVLIKKE